MIQILRISYEYILRCIFGAQNNFLSDNQRRLKKKKKKKSCKNNGNKKRGFEFLQVVPE